MAGNRVHRRHERQRKQAPAPLANKPFRRLVNPLAPAEILSPEQIATRHHASVRILAEALAGISLTQLVNPGSSVIYGGFTTNVDMQSGSPAFGTPEGAMALIGGAQLARHYGLPYRGSGGLNNSKIPDAQAANETQMMLHFLSGFEINEEALLAYIRKRKEVRNKH